MPREKISRLMARKAFCCLPLGWCFDSFDIEIGLIDIHCKVCRVGSKTLCTRFPLVTKLNEVEMTELNQLMCSLIFLMKKK